MRRESPEYRAHGGNTEIHRDIEHRTGRHHNSQEKRLMGIKNNREKDLHHRKLFAVEVRRRVETIHK